MDEIMGAVAALQGGDRQGARARLLELWTIWSDSDAATERCTIAHFLADTEEDPRDELRWDLIALEAATGGKDDEDRNAVAPGLEAFLPSLHLNVGDAYRRVGQPEHARRHAEMGLSHTTALNDDPYGSTIKAGIERLLSRLDGGS